MSSPFPKMLRFATHAGDNASVGDSSGVEYKTLHPKGMILRSWNLAGVGGRVIMKMGTENFLTSTAGSNVSIMSDRNFESLVGIQRTGLVVGGYTAVDGDYYIASVEHHSSNFMSGSGIYIPDGKRIIFISLDTNVNIRVSVVIDILL